MTLYPKAYNWLPQNFYEQTLKDSDTVSSSEGGGKLVQGAMHGPSGNFQVLAISFEA